MQGPPQPAGNAPPQPAGNATARQPTEQQATERQPAEQNAVAPAFRVRRRSTRSHLGPLPVLNVVVIEVGLAVGLVLLAVNPSLWWVAVGVLLVAVVLGLARWRGRWLVSWLQLVLGYLVGSHDRGATSPDPVAATTSQSSSQSIIGADDPRVSLLRLMLPDLIVAQSTDHEREPLGLAWHHDSWTAVLQVDAAPSLISPVGATPNLPLGALTPCLEDRGVVLDAIQVIWHCYPGSAALPSSSPALRSYLEVLGPLPAAARRTTWVAVRLDPRRCLTAIQERGGGVVGAHRALIGALSRIRSALQARGVQSRPLDADQLLRAGICAAELSSVAATEHRVALRERWTGVTAAGVGHASYAITGWAIRGGAQNLNALTGVRALSTTVALSVSPGEDGADVGLRGVVRISARNPEELEAADNRLHMVSERLGVSLTPLRGQQIAGLAATIPLGASP